MRQQALNYMFPDTLVVCINPEKTPILRFSDQI